MAKGEPRLARKLETAGEPVRLQRLLASAGFGSRREVEALLVEGRVSVNGDVAALGDRARPGVDDIRLDGERVLSDRPVYWIVNKPRGVVTTVRDESGRRTVLDLLPSKLGRVFPVGRLDVETTGLLLLTNDGETAYAMLHPSLGNEREYKVSVKGQIDAKAIARIEKGVHLEEGTTAPGRVDDVRIDPKAGTSSFTLTLVEGRNRQIRRSLLILGFPVRRLVRERMGPLRLGSLAVGEARALTPEERTTLLAHVAALKSGGRPRRSARVARPTGLGTRTGRPKRAPDAAGSSTKPASGRPVREASPARSGKPARPTRPTRPGGGAGAGAGVGRPQRGERPQRGASSRKGVRK
ncbi:MAG: rRNA pseudouridine synthase [Deltaproteobacteria bacterium]|nr:rRNA pseudouridine synthase [Deltaproteobacteria bacterium]